MIAQSPSELLDLSLDNKEEFNKVFPTRKLRSFQLLKDTYNLKAGTVFIEDSDPIDSTFDYVIKNEDGGRIEFALREDIENNPEWFKEI